MLCHFYIDDNKNQPWSRENLGFDLDARDYKLLKYILGYILNSSSKWNPNVRGSFFKNPPDGIKKQMPLGKTNFLRYTTLLLGAKRFFNSKGPKIALCLC